MKSPEAIRRSRCLQGFKQRNSQETDGVSIFTASSRPIVSFGHESGVKQGSSLDLPIEYGSVYFLMQAHTKAYFWAQSEVSA
jgi:hypothetical protein